MSWHPICLLIDCTCMLNKQNKLTQTYQTYSLDQRVGGSMLGCNDQDMPRLN